MSTQIFLTSTGTNTWTVPSDFTAVNTVEVIGAGGGGATNNSSTPPGGGDGAGYGKISNVSLTPGTSISYTIATGGINQSAGTTSDGGDAGDTYFNGASLSAAPVGSSGGKGGKSTGAGGGTPGAGKGTVTHTGGSGASGSGSAGSANSGGGGGAAGLNGNGNAAGTGSPWIGGSGDAGFGGSGGNNSAGGNGTEYDGTHGSGGGASGGSNQNAFNANSGGSYGSGGGGGRNAQASSSGIPGLIVITYTSAFTSARYWVGGTGNWDASSTAHWSLSSGGATGASVPTTANDVVFDLNSGGGTITLTASANARSISSVSFTGTLALSSQTLTLGGTGSVLNLTSGLTLSTGTSTIKLTDASATSKTFAGGNLTYYNLWITGSGTGTYTISGSNTFNDFKVDTPPHTVNFTAGTTQTVATFTVNGTAGNLMTLQSTSSGKPWFIHKSSVGTITCDYLSLQDSHAS